MYLNDKHDELHSSSNIMTNHIIHFHILISKEMQKRNKIHETIVAILSSACFMTYMNAAYFTLRYNIISTSPSALYHV